MTRRMLIDRRPKRLAKHRAAMEVLYLQRNFLIEQHPDSIEMTAADSVVRRSEEHTSELQSHRDLHSFPTRRSSDLPSIVPPWRFFTSKGIFLSSSIRTVSR